MKAINPEIARELRKTKTVVWSDIIGHSDETREHQKHLGQLLGGKIVAVGCQTDEYLGNLPTIVVEINNTLVICSILADPEGNGPGHLDIP